MLEPHQRVGDFEIIRLLGKGGMGRVYEARQLHPERPVALKELAPWLAGDEDALARFWREASALARLDEHPGIVRIISTGKTPEGVAFYAMQLVRGGSLADLLRTAGQTPHGSSVEPTVSYSDTPGETPNGVHAATPDAREVRAGETPAGALQEYRLDRYRLAARVGAAAARILGHAHRQGFLHRDVKPSNLMIDHSGQVYLLDFGLVRGVVPGGAGATHVGALRGTPWYMSPEQARGEPVDARSDIYSLGVTLYELVTCGVGPFTANREHSESVLAQVRAGQVLPLRMLAPDVPLPLEQAILRAMHFKTHRRYPTADDLAADLERFLGTPTPAASTATLRPPSPLRRSRRALMLGILLAALLGGGGYMATSYFGNSNPPEAAPPDPPAGPVRERPWGQVIPLLKPNMDPYWHSRLLGEGRFYPISESRSVMPDGQVLVRRGHLILKTDPGKERTLIALDDDPLRRDCLFRIDVQKHRGFVRHEAGIFFGWNQTADGKTQYYWIKIEDPPAGQEGQSQIVIGSYFSMKGDGARGGTYEPERHIRTMTVPVPPKHWHELLVRISKGKVIVTAPDGLRSVEFEPTFDPHGPLGIWANQGMASYRNATVTALEPVR